MISNPYRVKKPKRPVLWIKVLRSKLHANVRIPSCMNCGAMAEETLFNSNGGSKCCKCEPAEGSDR